MMRKVQLPSPRRVSPNQDLTCEDGKVLICMKLMLEKERFEILEKKVYWAISFHKK